MIASREEVRLLAAQRAMDVLPFDDAVAIGSEVLSGRFAAISVLRWLEMIEQRRIVRRLLSADRS